MCVCVCVCVCVERRDWDDWTQEDSEPPQASLAHVRSGSGAGNKEEARYFMRKLHTARATARVEREAPESKDTATSLRRARAASLMLKHKGKGV